MLTRLIYASEPTAPLSPPAVQAIVDGARAANTQRQITGMLVFDSRAFLQVLEGRRDEVSETFCRIAQDQRHRGVLLMEVTPVDERLFGEWSMGFAAADARGRGSFLRFSGDRDFNPGAMTSAGALGLLRAMAAVA